MSTTKGGAKLSHPTRDGIGPPLMGYGSNKFSLSETHNGFFQHLSRSVDQIPSNFAHRMDNLAFVYVSSVETLTQSNRGSVSNRFNNSILFFGSFNVDPHPERIETILSNRRFCKLMHLLQ